MAAPLGLYRASRDELMALVLRQRDQLVALERDQGRRMEVATQRAAMAALQERVGVRLAVLDAPDGEDAPSRPTTMPGHNLAGRTRPNGSAARSRQPGAAWR